MGVAVRSVDVSPEQYAEQMKALGIDRGGLEPDGEIPYFPGGSDLAKEPLVFHRKMGERIPKPPITGDMIRFQPVKAGNRKHYREPHEA